MPIINASSSRDISLWAQLQSGGALAVNNSGGTWNSSGAAKLRYDSFSATAQNPINTPTYKTGKRSALIGVRGRQGGSWSLSKPLIPSGTAGTAPDDDPVLQAIFGAAPTVVASTSVTYNLADLINFLTFFRFNRTPGLSNPTNTYVLGAFVNSFSFTGGGNFLNMSLSGSAVGVGDSVNFPSYGSSGDSVLEGGLTTFPVEPGSATQNGNVIPGFGSGAGFSFDGSQLLEVRNSVEISGSTGAEGVNDAISNPYLVAAMGGARAISISRIQAIDSDDSLLNTVKQASFSKSTHTIVLQFGNVAGSIVTFTLNNVQLGGFSFTENGAALDISLDASMAHASSASVTNEMTVAFT